MLEKVLIVDDSKFSRNTTRKLLESLGHTIVGEAVDGKDGLTKCKELKPDLIITDIEMPDINGIEMIKELNETNLLTKIIILSSVVNSQVMQEALKYRTPVIKKPLKEAKFLSALELLV